MTTKELIESLRSNTCPACGGGKRPRASLCYGCFTALPKSMRARLYDLVGHGYEQAVGAALNYLKQGSKS